jgi:hypothetical protein
MPVFDDMDWNELGPRPYAQPDFIYLNAVGSPGSSSNSRCHCGAETFEATVKLGVPNSRMNDFYDLRVLSSRLAFDGKTLSEAVRKTFLNRGTELPANGMPLAFTLEFYDNTNKKKQWTAFCEKNATYMVKTEFNTLIETLKIFLVPVVAAVHERALFSLQWTPAVPARNRTRRLKGVTQK